MAKDYARPALDKTRLGQLIDLITNIRVGDEASRAKDVLGRVYEYFLSQFDVATYVNGAAYSAFEPNEERRGLPIIKIAELESGVTQQTRFSDVQMPEKYRIGRGDILFSWSGNPDTSIDTFVWSHSEAWLNQHIFRVLPHRAHERFFVLMLLRHLRVCAKITSDFGGSATGP
ncbi:MAG TPA: hypothetical protein PK640_01420, partial [Verrucomicrobiota bacterium]|nr:hypothetical protein [Verrucomicrobiota bacterium]